MENDLISKRDLKEYIRKSDLTSREKATLLWAAEHVPAISPDSLRERGEWVRKTDGVRYWYVCSRCEEETTHSRYGVWNFPAYCPSCGARMNLEG